MSRGILAVGKHSLLSLIANVTANEVTLESNQILGTLEHLDSAAIFAELLEIHCILNESSGESTETTHNKTSNSNTDDEIAKLKEAIPLLNIDLTPFDSNDATDIAKLLLRYAHIFDTNHSRYGAAKGVEHVIKTPNAQPISQVPHRVSPAERQIINKMTNEMLTSGVIQPSTSPWASPVVLVKKKRRETTILR